MNAEEFYEEFKETLKFLGVGWGDKHLVTVEIVDNELKMSAGRLSVTIKSGDHTVLVNGAGELVGSVSIPPPTIPKGE